MSSSVVAKAGAAAAAATAVGVALGWCWCSTLLAAAVAAYLPSYLDGSEYTPEGRYWDWLATHPIWKRVFARHSPTCVFEEPLDSAQQYILCSHPHGVMSLHHPVHFLGASGLSDVVPGLNRRSLSASIILKLPLIRDFAMWGGCVNAHRTVANKILAAGKSILVLVGGEREQLMARPGRQEVFIAERKGFMKLALRHGVPVVPSYCFGEVDLYDQSRLGFGLRTMISRKFGIAITLGTGPKWWCPLISYPVQLACCFGKPIVVEQSDEPTQEQIDEAHARYVAELKRVYNKHKADYGYGDVELEVH